MIHYFPPLPDRIGDNLLTLEIALQLIQTKGELTYYASQLVIEILERFKIKNIRYTKILSLKHSLELAKNARDTFPTIDLQQLNLFHCYPHLRSFFDEHIHPRAKCDWYDPETIKRWGLLHFPDIFRQMLEMPRINVKRPRLRVKKRASHELLLFPHNLTPGQQLNFWADIAALATRRFRTGIVGKAIVKQLAPWPADVDFYCDLSGGELVDVIGNASICIGGSNGLLHMAAELGLPSLMISKWNDTAIFKPIRSKTVSVITAKEHFSSMKTPASEILESVNHFLSQVNLRSSNLSFAKISQLLIS